MRITKVSVEKLFGIFDHEIPLNQDSRITIIHGPNGVGKTVLLSLLHSLFHYEYELIDKIKFKQFRIEFEGGAFITIKGSADNRKLSIQYDDGAGTEFKPFEPRLSKPSEGQKSLAKHTYRFPFHGIPFGLEGPVGYEEDINKFLDIHTDLYGEAPEWLQHIHKETKSVLIHTHRLQSGRFDKFGLTPHYYDIDEDVDPTVVDFSTKFAEHITGSVGFGAFVDDLNQQQKLQKLAETEADLISNAPDEELTASHLAARRDQLQSITQKIENRYQGIKLFKETMLFKDIINERVLFKSLDITSIHKGFWFIADDGSEVPLSALSSGEQHLIVLYYYLLFEVYPDTLVMIDEPELSLHVVWQRSFLKDLQRIVKLRKFDVLVATHSPQIVHDKWGWMVGLGEPESES